MLKKNPHNKSFFATGPNAALAILRVPQKLCQLLAQQQQSSPEMSADHECNTNLRASFSSNSHILGVDDACGTVRSTLTPPPPSGHTDRMSQKGTPTERMHLLLKSSLCV